MRISDWSSDVCSSDLAAAVQAAKAVRRRDDVGNAYAVFFVDHDNFALCDQVAVNEDIHGFAGKAVQLYDRTLAKLQDVLDRQARTAQFDRQLHGNIHDHVDVAVALDVAAG